MSRQRRLWLFISGLTVIVVVVMFALPRYRYRSIVIHHTASPADNYHSIRELHRKRGWGDAAYHLILSNGSNGVPAITASAYPETGTSVDLQVGNSLGADTAGALMVGFSRASLPGGWGGPLLVRPALTWILAIPAVGLTVPIAVPDDPELCGVYVFLQALEVDPGAAKGISSTAGLLLFLGD